MTYVNNCLFLLFLLPEMTMLCGRKRKVFHAASRGKAYIYLLLILSRLFLYSGTASHIMSPRSQGNSSQKPQWGIPLSRAHILTLQSLHVMLFAPGPVHPVHFIFDGSMNEYPPRLSSAAASLESVSISFLSVALRASHELQSMPQQPVISIRIFQKREILRLRSRCL